MTSDARLEMLEEDNAFVDLAGVLADHKKSGAAAAGPARVVSQRTTRAAVEEVEVDDALAALLGGGNKGRLPIRRLLAVQHRRFRELQQLEEVDAASVGMPSTANNEHEGGASQPKQKKGASKKRPRDEVNRSVADDLAAVGSLAGDLWGAEESGQTSNKRSFLSFTAELPRDLSCGGKRLCHHRMCCVCLGPAPYRCARCKSALFCSIDCHEVHEATRCLKHVV